MKNLQSLSTICLSGILALGFLACSKSDATTDEQTGLDRPYQIDVSSSPILLNPDDPDETELGRLIYRGGIELKSPNSNFGGLSGLLVSPDRTKFIAVTDTGRWVTGTLTYKNDMLAGITDVQMAPLLNPQGEQLKNKKQSDAESLTGHWETGSEAPKEVFVSFEVSHRIWSYPFGHDGFAALPTAVPIPSDLLRAKANSGLESIELLNTPGNPLLILTEGEFETGGNIPAWLLTKNGSMPLFLANKEPFNATDLGTLPSGDILVLERRFSPLGGVGMRLRKIEQSLLQENAIMDGPELIHLASPYTVDNMEGLSIRTGAKGETLLYIVSDDNFNPLQRTLLMMFELKSGEE